MFKVTYLYHSEILVELDRCLLLFDHYAAALPPFPAEKPLFVFVSHKHGDHFRRDILDFAEDHPDVNYIISSEVEAPLREHPRYASLTEKIFPMQKHETQEFCCGGETITVRTLRSTDLGLAFLVKAEGRTVFHAGDLNLWLWSYKNETQKADMHRYYETEVAGLAEEKIDIVIHPLDDRLGTAAAAGPDYFMRHVDVRYLLPVHYWDDYDMPRRFAADPVTEPYRDRLLLPEHENTVFVLE